MRYLETKHERDSAKITTLIIVIIVLLLFVVGPPYMDPPEEYGVAVNFGTTDFGKGDTQPLKPIKSEPQKVETPPQPEVSKAEPSKPSETKEDVLAADNAEEIAIKKQKEAESKAKAIADAKTKAEAERIAKEKQEQDEKKKKLDALIGGVSKSEGTETGGEGNDNKQGDKGRHPGDPYAPSDFGAPGTGSGGVGYGLNGRGSPSYKTIKQDCNQSGMVIVKITVNQNGNVIEAVPGSKGTTNTDPCLLEPAKKIALSHKWQPDPKAPAKQYGFVKVNFNLGQ
ncbi:energy transducer TonB [Mariniflexile ostreae]|uniref:Energy transducer TonB n=1 Tax=Mariniflexile ostreae TaxID=1520892 RepID=A0ABV5FDH8_9FLAO